MIVTPVSTSPGRRAAWVGPAPRQRGSREACTFRQPWGAARRSEAGRIWPKAATMMTSGAQAAIAAGAPGGRACRGGSAYNRPSLQTSIPTQGKGSMTTMSAPESTSDDRLWAALAYVFSPLVPIILLLWEEKKQRPFIKAHNMQALFLGIFEVFLCF